MLPVLDLRGRSARIHLHTSLCDKPAPVPIRSAIPVVLLDQRVAGAVECDGRTLLRHPRHRGYEYWLAWDCATQQEIDDAYALVASLDAEVSEDEAEALSACITFYSDPVLCDEIAAGSDMHSRGDHDGRLRCPRGGIAETMTGALADARLRLRSLSIAVERYLPFCLSLKVAEYP